MREANKVAFKTAAEAEEEGYRKAGDCRFLVLWKPVIFSGREHQSRPAQDQNDETGRHEDEWQLESDNRVFSVITYVFDGYSKFQFVSRESLSLSPGILPSKSMLPEMP
jgi:hypothetical protein